MKVKLSPVYLLICALLVISASACNYLAPSPAPAPVQATIMPPLPTPVPAHRGISPVSLPEKRADQAGDPDSSANAHKKLVSGGDTFVYNLYERPFNADPMDVYFPQYDIVDTQGFKDDIWGYATITLSGLDPNNQLSGKYGAELDLNKDGQEYSIRCDA